MKNKEARDKYMQIIKEQADKVSGYDRNRGWIKKVLNCAVKQECEIATRFAQEAAKRLGIDND